MEKRRSGGDSQWSGARPARTILTILAVMGAIFVVDAILGHPAFIREHLALRPRRALGPEPWQLLTSGFVHLQIGGLLSTAITFWFFGSPVEQQLGRGGLLRVLLFGTLAGSLATAALGRFIAPDALSAGAGPASTALLAAFGVIYGSQPLSLFGVQQMRASTLAIVFLAISGVLYLANMDFLGLAGAAAGAGAGALSAMRGFDLGGTTTRLRERFKRWRIRRRYKVLPGGRDRRSFLN
jgi:membrane associated rhomboid family serine protease